MTVADATRNATSGHTPSTKTTVPLMSTGLGGDGGGGDGGAGGGVGSGGGGVGPGDGGGIASCTTERVSPAIVARPERSLLVLAAAISVTVPLALPLAPPVTVSHDALLEVVQLQPVSVSTDTVMDPPACPTL